MKNDSLFRTSMVGGYNKDDVKAYIEKLEKEMADFTNILDALALPAQKLNDFQKT